MRKWLVAGAIFLAASPAYAIFTNGGFETGSFSGWTQAAGINQSLTGSPPFTSASLNIGAGGTFRSAVVSAGTDPRAPQLALPRVGSFTALVNHPTQAGGILNSISQQDAITNADRDANDNLLHVRFSYAAVLLDSGHADNQRPFFFVRLRNITKSTTLYEDFAYEQQPGKTFILGTNGYRYTQFQNIDIVVPDADLGDTLEIEALASDCSPTAHPGYVYLDGFGSAVVGPPGGPAGPVDVPTLSEWGLILLALGIGAITLYAQRRARYH